MQQGWRCCTKALPVPTTCEPRLPKKDASACRTSCTAVRATRDKERSVWTLKLAAQVSFEQGIIDTEVSTESVRRALKRLKTNWKRAKHWITSPDPLYLKKNSTRSIDRLGQPAAELGDWLRR